MWQSRDQGWDCLSPQLGWRSGEGQRHTKAGLTEGCHPVRVEGQDQMWGKDQPQMGTRGLQEGGKARRMGVDGDRLQVERAWGGLHDLFSFQEWEGRSLAGYEVDLGHCGS